MTRQIRLLGVALMVCFAVLFAQLNWLTVFHANSLNGSPSNTREALRLARQPRGSIVTADGTVIARSVPSNDRYERQRAYPQGPLFAHVTGFLSLFLADEGRLSSAGVERAYYDELVGGTVSVSDQLGDLFVDKERTGDLSLTVRADLQRIASDQLGAREGSVVALDPRTGAILAMVSYPSYDPNLLANHDTKAAAAADTLLDASPEKPLRSRSYQDRFFPGSTFKVVTATAALTSGTITADEPSYPVRRAFLVPNRPPLDNFGGSACGGRLFDVLRVSCNSAFAQMGVDAGPEAMTTTAERFGFNQDVPIDLPLPAQSVFPGGDVREFRKEKRVQAGSAIGQNDVAATPLQMAMVAGAIANDGTVMTPHVLFDVRDNDGNVVRTYRPKPWTTAMDRGTSALLREAMVGVAERGTATRLRVPGFTVGGKTGTAQLGTDPARSHAWIIGFAGPPNEAPTIAVAVIVEGQPGASEQTGGRVAAPIAQAVLQAYLTTPGR
ncbi:MAG: peptidoglycan D,D-transpeptidase FtsI family protein [Microthrixaceae bacterium]